ncbi:hypothetical protein BGX23_010660 [Mortierella sp. AD031]|nr:hypothetical protein BGX23_010660 [Mortierella sp. AD031]
MAMGWYLKAAYEGSADAQRKVDAFRFETTNRNTVAPAASLNAILGNQLDPMDVASSVEKADDIAEMATVSNAHIDTLATASIPNAPEPLSDDNRPINNDTPKPQHFDNNHQPQAS